MKSSKPILFSGEMVRAILDGRKTQTRRIVKGKWLPIVEEVLRVNGKWVWSTMDADLTTPYGELGAELWVKETFKYLPDDVSTIIRMQADGCTIDAGWATEETKRKAAKGGWTPSIFMPRWASRITLEIVSVRVERLQEISEGDAMAEGWPHGESTCGNGGPFDWYRNLWKQINGPESWNENPWCWCISFKRITPQILMGEG